MNGFLVVNNILAIRTHCMDANYNHDEDIITAFNYNIDGEYIRKTFGIRKILLTLFYCLYRIFEIGSIFKMNPKDY
jgi:hypothetical protein